MALQATGSIDANGSCGPEGNEYSLTLCWDDGPWISFDGLLRDDLEHLQSLLEVLLEGEDD